MMSKTLSPISLCATAAASFERVGLQDSTRRCFHWRGMSGQLPSSPCTKRPSLRRARLERWFWILILLWVSLWSRPGRADPPGQLEGRATRDMQIEFVTPTDWGCTKRATCTVCRNVTDHPTSIRIGALNESTRRTQSLPPGAELEICSSGDAPS